MPISPIVIQRRHAELGRIRLGHKVGGNGRPEKLGAFRFTSASERYVRDLAELYGGTPQPWDNNGKAEFEVFSTATSIPVLVVKGGLSQWMETWSGGGVTHRCTGEQDVEGNLCDPGDPLHQQAKPTTRLSVMLPELEAVGVFRMESHGWNAAAEIPAVAELAQYVGPLVPAHLNLVERRAIKDGKTSRFVVPILDLEIGAARLRELAEAMSEGRELGPTSTPPQLSAPDPFAAYLTRVEEADTTDELSAVWGDAVAEHLVGSQATPTAAASGFTAAFKARAAAIQAGTGVGGTGAVSGGGTGEGGTDPTSEPSSPTDDTGVVDAELVDDDADAIWAEILRVAGERGMLTGDVEDGYAQWSKGILSSDATAAELRGYLTHLQARAA